MSTGALLDLALEQIEGNSHFIRLSKAVQMNLKPEGNSAQCSISVRSASALVKASIEDKNASLQKQVIQILQNEKRCNCTCCSATCNCQFYND
mmetsp:Transcript_3880/g.5935  ORF Transcript_3880/g.5935 Transcript_3880/m.5935 type:complete len:93 (-) Transcript_3880:603-881(-)